jgi:hypothetical protein
MTIESAYECLDNFIDEVRMLLFRSGRPIVPEWETLVDLFGDGMSAIEAADTIAYTYDRMIEDETDI